MIGDFYSKLAKREKILFFAAFLFTLIAFMDRFVLGPILQQQKLLQAEIDVKLQTIRNLQKNWHS